jgi:2,4-dienoyl-CoA reductase-like NADH-dependent reductase (Old Yellow Enzyme family)
MYRLFERTSIGSIELANRSVRSATWSGVANEAGAVTDLTTDFYGTLAKGSIGLIVSGYQCVMTNGNRLPHTLGNLHEDQTEGLARLSKAVHDQGGKIVAQIVHARSRANTRLFRDGDELWGPSPIPDPVSGRMPVEVDPEKILRLIDSFAAAADRCKRAGFDGVQLHAGHGYLINQFLSSVWNQRTDAYGGSLERRYRFLGEVAEAVQGAVGKEFPILVKLNGADYIPGGLVPEESLKIGRYLADAGIAAIEVSGGSAASGDGMGPCRKHRSQSVGEAYFADIARLFKEELDIPIIAVGGMRSLTTIEAVLANKKADCVAMCRPFIREPHIIKRWLGGDIRDAKCVSCNGCFETGMQGKGVSCRAEREVTADF